MSGTAHFERQLSRGAVESIAKTHGFASLVNVEKFLVDFEVLYHIQRAMPDCVVRGGMAVPFHLGPNGVARLSVDVDAVTGLDAEDSRRAMADAFAEMGDTLVDVKHHKPRSPKKLLPLHTYYCRYDSPLSAKEEEIKIDLFYGGRPSARTARFRPPTTLLGVDIDFGVTAYDHPQMIADKLSTLAFGTIGLDAGDANVPKHIHDIASMVMAAEGQIDMTEIAAAFGRTCREEAVYMPGRPPADGDVCDSLRTFHRSLLVPGTGLELGGSYAGRFATFATGMLARGRSKNRLHVTDVMLSGILAGLVADVHTSRLAAEEATETVNRIRDTLRKIGSMSVAEGNKLTKDLRGGYRRGSSDYDLVKTMQADHAYLYGHLPGPSDAP